jgi:hypothetical protein
MFTLLMTKEQILSLRVDDLILQHPSDESEASINPTGLEENSNTYRVHSITASEVTLESLPKGYIFGNVQINSMKKPVNGSQLLNGKWWIKN